MNKLTLIDKLTVENISLLISALFFIGSVVVSFCMGYVPRTRKEELEKLRLKLKQKNFELVSVYKDVYQLLQVESFLLEDAGISKQDARKGFTIRRVCHKKYVEDRIVELEEELNGMQ